MPPSNIDYTQLDFKTPIETYTTVIDVGDLPQYRQLVLQYPQSSPSSGIIRIMFNSFSVNRYIVAETTVNGESVWVAFIMLSKAPHPDLTDDDFVLDSALPVIRAPSTDQLLCLKCIFMHLDMKHVVEKDMTGYDFGDTLTIKKRKPDWDPAFALHSLEEAVEYLKTHCARDFVLDFIQIKVHLYDRYGWPEDHRFSA